MRLRAIIDQRIVDLHRKHLGPKSRDAATLSIDLPQVCSEMLATDFVDDTTGSQVAMREEAEAQVQAALDSMPSLDREVLALRHFETLGNSEVAEILEIKKTAASNRYVRALKRLKQVLTLLGLHRK